MQPKEAGRFVMILPLSMRLPTHGRGGIVGCLGGIRLPRADYNLGCSLFGEIEATPNQLRVSCGYRVEGLPREDSFLDNFEFTGVVLLLITTQERTVIGKPDTYSTVVASEPVRVAKTAAEIQNPENVYFENVLIAINPPPPSSPFERWVGRGTAHLYCLLGPP